MSKVIVIGGGLAGISSAVILAKKNFKVTLLEASHNPGGRVYSLPDEKFNSVIDNGQHIMMGCYNETIQFLKEINAAQNFYFQKALEVVFYKSGQYYTLKSRGRIYPINMIDGILSFDLFNLKERLELINFFIRLPVVSVRDIRKFSAEEWLQRSGQGENVRKYFWDAFIIGALNSTPENASAVILRDILLKIFFSGKKSASIIIPEKPLSEAFVKPALKFLQEHSAEISFPERVIKLVPDRNRRKIEKILTTRRIIKDFDYIISGVPLYTVKKIIPDAVESNFELTYSSILTVHFKCRKELFEYRFIAMTDSPVHWIFRHPQHFTIVISSAGELINKSIPVLEEFIKDELCLKFNLNRHDITAIKIIKEKRATFLPEVNPENRPKTTTNYKNLFLAGDWINTGLPSTIEGAVLSGKIAANQLFV